MVNNRKVINLIRLISLKFFNLYTYNQKTINKIDLKEFEIYVKNNDISQRYKDLILNLDFKSKIVVDTLLYRSTQVKKLIFSYNLSSKEIKQAAKDTFYGGYVGEYDIEIPSHFYQSIFPGLSYMKPLFLNFITDWSF